MKILYCFIFVVIFNLTACSKSVENYAIKYFIKTKASAKYNKLLTKFIIPRGQTKDNNTNGYANRSIYLSDQNIVLDTKANNKVFLGSSDLGEGEIMLKYDLSFTASQVEQGEKSLILLGNSNPIEVSRVLTDAPFTIQKNEARSVVFEIDTDASIVPQADGTLQFIPVVKTTFE